MILLLAACTTPTSYTGTLPILTGEGFWDRPFPSDTRLVDGHPDFSGFPGSGGMPIFDTYLALGPLLDGWGTNSPIFMRFAEVLDEEDFPTPAESLEDDSPIQLVDVDPHSPSRGERFPVVTGFTGVPDQYGASNLLAVAPLPGFPLRPGTEYALVVRSPLALPGAMPADWADSQEWADTVDTLRTLGVDLASVGAATQFTTQDPVGELARVAWAIQSGRVGRPAWEPEVTLRSEKSTVLTYEGYVTVPIWQEGERPYHEGGGFVFDEGGRPEVQGWERIRFALTTPPGAPPAGGWPVVLYSHGTGGDHLSFTSGVTAEGPALAGRGLAVFGISQPLHGDRATEDTNEEFDTFNYTNPVAGRTSFRQGAADQIWLAELLSTAANDFAIEGTAIPIRHDQLAFFGHSQGAMVGALGAPWLARRCNAVGLSAAGGGTAASAILKVDPIPVEPILAAAMGVPSGTLTTLHPVLGLVQMLSEATDPMNYGPYWFSEDPPWPAGRPVAILLTEGLEDTYTPPFTTESLATAARLPVVGKMTAEPAGFALRGLDEEGRPAERNVNGYDGSVVTAGLVQFPGQGHFAIYDDRDAKDLYRDFLETAAAGRPALPK
jgi:pimeloyl-ACP methyl ester carboxylesterase